MQPPLALKVRPDCSLPGRRTLSPVRAAKDVSDAKRHPYILGLSPNGYFFFFLAVFFAFFAFFAFLAIFPSVGP